MFSCDLPDGGDRERRHELLHLRSAQPDSHSNATHRVGIDWIEAKTPDGPVPQLVRPARIGVVAVCTASRRRIQPTSRKLILTISVLTVVFSMITHGISAVPGASWYAAQIGKHKEAENDPLEHKHSESHRDKFTVR